MNKEKFLEWLEWIKERDLEEFQILNTGPETSRSRYLWGRISAFDDVLHVVKYESEFDED